MLDMDVNWRRGDFELAIRCAIHAPVTAVFGPSGAGKSTLLHLIAGTERPDAGRIVLAPSGSSGQPGPPEGGQDAHLPGRRASCPPHARAGEHFASSHASGRVLCDTRAGLFVPAHRRRIGLVFQDGRLFPHYSVRGNLHYGRRLIPRRERRLTFEEVVEMLELGPLLDRQVGGLSGGERQRVALGRALLMSPDLLLLDEPLAALDAGLKRQVLPFLARVRDEAGIPMLYVSHDIGELLQLTHELLVLERGRVVGQGRFHEVINEPAVYRLARGLGLENVLRVRVVEHLPAEGLTRFVLLAGESGHDDTARRSSALPGSSVQRALDEERPAPRPAATESHEPAATGLRKPSGDGASFVGPLIDRPPGTVLHAAIRPEDIALAAVPVPGISIQNQIGGTVATLSERANKALIEVDVGGLLLVEVSLKSVHELNLAPGRPVYCLIKAHAIRWLDA